MWDQWVKPWLTHCWAPPKTLKSRARSSKAHTTLTRGVSRFSTDVRFSDLNLQRRTFAIFTITESFSVVTRARNKSHTTPDMGVTKFSADERSVYLNTHFLSITRSFSAVTRARSESITRLLLSWSVVQFSTNMRFGELNLHRCTFEHHRVPLGSDSCA